MLLDSDPDPHSQYGSGSRTALGSVADPDSPDPDPPDSHVFGPPGSGSISQRYESRSSSGSRSGSFYHQAKKVEKFLIDRYCFVTFFLLFIFENDIHVPSRSDKLFKQISFLLAFWCESGSGIPGFIRKGKDPKPEPDPDPFL
jgi:hypothetical protein